MKDPKSEFAWLRKLKVQKGFEGMDILQKVFFALIVFYRYLISPFLPPACRFYPTCSDYALGCITKYGGLKGGLLAAKRILRCHPFNPGGFDPVP